jgi:AcrR family transcriptional regulator
VLYSIFVREPVKIPRPYYSRRHAELRSRTRADILAAARTLFTRDGYGQATIERIAAEADVAVQTVYAVFGNKRALLLALMDVALAGDEQPRSVLERIDAVLGDTPELMQRLARAVEFGTQAIERSADIHRVLAGAAQVDGELRVAFLQGEDNRYSDMQTIVDLVAGEAASPPVRQRASELMFVLLSYDVFELLVRTRGWPREGWSEWAVENLARALSLG